MATAATALSVYKRFQAFPCIIQNNPLVFSRKTDPKVSPQSKIIAAPQQPSEVSHPPAQRDWQPFRKLPMLLGEPGCCISHKNDV